MWKGPKEGDNVRDRTVKIAKSDKVYSIPTLPSTPPSLGDLVENFLVGKYLHQPRGFPYTNGKVTEMRI